MGKELSSIMGLRGLAFYTTRSGYKLGDSWFSHGFSHGLLLVENNGEISVYTWSPRRMAFHVLERPELLFVSPFKSCTPRAGFLEELRFL